MLIEIQKKLNSTTCPSCSKKNVLQATLSCSRDEKKCTTSCQCIECGLSLIVLIPDELNNAQLSSSELKLECSLTNSQCEVVGVETYIMKAG